MSIKSDIEKEFKDLHPSVLNDSQKIRTEILKEAEEYDNLPEDTDDAVRVQKLASIKNQLKKLLDLNKNIKNSYKSFGM